MNKQELLEALSLGREQRHIEFKGPGSRSDKLFLAGVARAAMAMANLRDGGHVLIGITEGVPGLSVVGLSDEQIESWRHHDHVADALDELADPNLRFDTTILGVEGRQVVELKLAEFSDTPVICRRDVTDGSRVILRSGAVYVRPRRKPESVEVGTLIDMRDLLELAIDKGVREFVRRATNAGLEVAAGGRSDEERFARQEGDFLASPLVEEIKRRGHYIATVRPLAFSEDRVAYNELEDILSRCAVRLRGWSFPEVGGPLGRNEISRGQEWIEQEISWSYYREKWRFHQSGLFIFIAGFRWDWADVGRGSFPPAPSWASADLLPITYVVFWITELFEFAARLAMSAAGSEAIGVGVEFLGLKDRFLHSEHPLLGCLVQDFRSDIESFSHPGEFARGELVAEPRAHAAEFALELFSRFGWNGSVETIREIQGGLAQAER